MKRITALLLALLLALTLGACGGASNSGGEEDVSDADVSVSAVYTIDGVKEILVDVLGIDEAEVTVEDRDTGSVMSYGDWGTWFDTYILKDPKDAQDMFDIQTWEDTAYDKRVDKKDHKIWIEESEDSSDDSKSYTLIAMKGNLVISITGPTEPETLIEALDLE